MLIVHVPRLALRVERTLEGADAGALAEKLNARLGGSLGAAPAAPAASAAEDLQKRLKALTTSAPVLVFMKGNREEPRCGFSRKVVAALAETGADFETFDILEDEEVRQGLKEYSDWPTYPQLYVKGELVGGCDIILEMAADGSLKETLTAAA